MHGIRKYRKYITETETISQCKLDSNNHFYPNSRKFQVTFVLAPFIFHHWLPNGFTSLAAAISVVGISSCTRRLNRLRFGRYFAIAFQMQKSFDANICKMFKSNLFQKWMLHRHFGWKSHSEHCTRISLHIKPMGDAGYRRECASVIRRLYVKVQLARAVCECA